VYYGTDGTYHDWYLQSLVVALQVRVGTLSLYTIRGVNCVSLQFGSFIYYLRYTTFRVPKK